MRQSFTLSFRQKTLHLGKRTCIMGVVNITPDSFFDGGRYLSPQSAIDHAQSLIDEGADILDLGGQSTRPTSEPVGKEEELRRVLPVLQEIRKQSDIWISIDTYRADVAKVCLQEGADLINDVSSFRMDPEMAGLIAQQKVPVVCMHFLETLHPMPKDPTYKNLFADIQQFFEETFTIAQKAGLEKAQILIDPGIGFGKTLEDNLRILNGLEFLEKFQRPILIGPSRKSFIGKITGEPAEGRLEGTAAAVAAGLFHGANIIRVHDVGFFRSFCNVLDEILAS